MPEKRILVVESEKEMAQAITGALARFDAKVTVIEDGKKVLTVAKSPPASLIILRVELPGQSGYSICMKLRKERDLKDIPLILTSSEANEDTFESHRKLKVRADEYMILRRPFPADELVAKVTSLVPLEEVATSEEPEIITLDEDESVTLADDEAFSSDELQDLGAVETADSTVVMETPTTDGADEELPSLDDVLDNLDLEPEGKPQSTERLMSAEGKRDDELASLDDVLESLDDAAEVVVDQPEAGEAAAEDLDLSLLDDMDVKGGESGKEKPAAEAEPKAEAEEDLLDGLTVDEPTAAEPTPGGEAAESELDLDAIVKSAEDSAAGAGDGAGAADEAEELLAGLESEVAAASAVEAPKPVEIAKPAEAPKPVETAKPAEAPRPAPKPAEAAKPAEAVRPSGPAKPDPVLQTKLLNLEQDNGLLRDKVKSLETKIEEMHQSLEKRDAELGNLRGKTSSKDKDFLALKATINQKDREILELKEEITRKDQEILESQEKVGDSAQENARQLEMLASRDREIKELAGKYDTLLKEKHELDQLHQAKMAEWQERYSRETEDLEARLRDASEELKKAGATAAKEREALEGRLKGMQTEFDEAKQRHADEVFGLRARFKGQLEGLESKISGLSKDLAETQKKLSEEQSAHSETREEAARIPGLEAELERARKEIGELEGQVADLRSEVAEREDRVVRAYERIKADEKIKMKARQAVEIAASLLSDQVEEDEEGRAEGAGDGEPAEDRKD